MLICRTRFMLLDSDGYILTQKACFLLCVPAEEMLFKKVISSSLWMRGLWYGFSYSDSSCSLDLAQLYMWIFKYIRAYLILNLLSTYRWSPGCLNQFTVPSVHDVSICPIASQTLPIITLSSVMQIGVKSASLLLWLQVPFNVSSYLVNVLGFPLWNSLFIYSTHFLCDRCFLQTLDINPNMGFQRKLASFKAELL